MVVHFHCAPLLASLPTLGGEPEEECCLAELPCFASADEDWKRFGWLLDSSEGRRLTAACPTEQQMASLCLKSRSCSPVSLHSGRFSLMEVSSDSEMDEDDGPAFRSRARPLVDPSGDEPVAKRTRLRSFCGPQAYDESERFLISLPAPVV